MDRQKKRPIAPTATPPSATAPASTAPPTHAPPATVPAPAPAAPPTPAAPRSATALAAAALAVLLPLAAACGTERADGAGSPGGGGPGAASAAPPATVTGVHWGVDDVTADGATHRAPGAWLRIDPDGAVAGSTGCNGFGARARVDGSRVRLSDILLTKRACASVPVAVEHSLVGALTDGPVTATAPGPGRLTLTTADGDTVRLSERSEASLYGTEWEVTDPGGTTARLTFDRAGGTVAGRLPCNRVSATATVRDGRITLGVPRTTRMMCEGSLMAAEKRMLRLFEGRADYRIDQDTLTLTREDGTFVRAVAVR
ncbi:META domain-containing protein [Streptomyces sp. SID8352]|uniref:META domain-containing protein n=1 Tax=Streptomyces sp. SID8352 TaxID=2690338 RepID=UPI00136A14E2|nr:META domain-containing protein [Streptomyces sp. SID8352]MYU25114.1 META domain-containing protein [Streptomyces sp. SID8352]